MLNFIAIALTNYLVTEVYKAPDQMTPHTPLIHEAAQLPRLSAFSSVFLPSNPVNITLFFAFGLIGLTQFVLTRTKWGYEIRFVGNAAEVATYAGINVRRVTVWTMALSGAIAGFAGVWEVMGYRHRFLDNFSPGFGFTGIAVALLGRNHPYGILFRRSPIRRVEQRRIGHRDFNERTEGAIFDYPRRTYFAVGLRRRFQ